MISHEDKVEKVTLDNPEVKNAAMKVLIGPDEGWDDHVMRVFEIEKGGFTPKHGHEWPHINYILEGEGYLFLDGEKTKISKGSIAYIPAGKEHQFQNPESEKLKLMCIVPVKGHQF